MMNVATGADELVELSYTGQKLRNVFTNSPTASSPAFSHSHDIIIWYQAPSEIHVQGAQNQSLRLTHHIEGEHIVQIQVYGEQIYWAQRTGDMGVFSKKWNDTHGEVTTIQTFRSDSPINDFVIVHPPSQPYPGVCTCFATYILLFSLSIYLNSNSYTLHNNYCNNSEIM